MDLFNFLAGLSSIIGLGVTVYVAYTIKNIRAAYIRQAMLPQLVKRLRQITKNLEQAIHAKDDSVVRKALAQAGSLAKNIERFAPDRRNMRDLDQGVIAAQQSSGVNLYRLAADVNNKMVAEADRLSLMKLETEWRN